MPAPDTVVRPTRGELVLRRRLQGEWTCVGARSYGTRVFQVVARRTLFVKLMPASQATDLRFRPREEALRLRWLADHGIPTPAVVEVGEDEELAWLVTEATRGRTAASPWAPEERPRVLEALAGLARSLHRLPVDDCPFDGGLGTTRRWAETATREGWVDVEDLDPEHHGWSAEMLLAKLRATPEPPEDSVVCHGDLCLDNVLIDPETLRVASVLDAGRLGVADRWRDLSLLLRSLCDGEWPGCEDAGTALLRHYGTHLDRTKAEFYRLLDEFY